VTSMSLWLIASVRSASSVIAVLIALTLGLRAQEHVHPAGVDTVPLQPLAQHVRRLETALAYLGQPLSSADREAVDGAMAMSDGPAVLLLQQILDRHVIATVHINPESRVRVRPGPTCCRAERVCFW
jgi:hypothetical protein